jgi:flagellar assembly factor FliW
VKITTTRFGEVEVGDGEIVFASGLLGFEGQTRWVLLSTGPDSCYFWFQSVDDPNLAFVVTDPTFFEQDYSVPIRPEQMDSLGISKLEDAQVFVIVNKIDDQLTGNLQGPLIINTVGKVGEQVVLADTRWSACHPLVHASKNSPSG